MWDEIEDRGLRSEDYVKSCMWCTAQGRKERKGHEQRHSIYYQKLADKMWCDKWYENESRQITLCYVDALQRLHTITISVKRDHSSLGPLSFHFLYFSLLTSNYSCSCRCSVKYHPSLKSILIQMIYVCVYNYLA